MEVPQELEQIKRDLKQYETNINEALHRLESFRAAYPSYDKFGHHYLLIDSNIREALEKMSEIQRYFGELFVAIEQSGAYTKDFDLYPSDRVRITVPAQEPFPAGWAEGKVLEAHFYEPYGWYIEFEKDNVSPGWQTGYGYWKQDVDGGKVEKIY